MFSFGEARPARRPSLTPMIDVVFLLLVFFMLASRFGGESVIEIGLATGAGGGDWQGAPRLLSVGAEVLRLNGTDVALADVALRMAPLMPEASAPIILRSDGADLQRLLDVMEALRAGGFSNLVLVE
ncbi:biopolymer transporter ExbD [Thioclava sp. A2]|uniref:ExbD/TolR family protein n=1 Tax=Thioclava sp. FCG-A2 TaxID=3080562 RepID=UPI002953B45E|nr:biopolymer transporter ExbD [Thioclava sp. A2]MDV7269411.1 biopolymer transporter ExbD [Thioclava sp. A2]